MRVFNGCDACGRTDKGQQVVGQSVSPRLPFFNALIVNVPEMTTSEHQMDTGLGRRLVFALVGLVLFAVGYGVANRLQLTHNVLYRLAAGDHQSAAGAFFFLSLQAAVLLAALFLVSRRATWVLFLAIGISIAANLGYGQLVEAPLDAGSFAWLLAEARQARQAAGEFGSGLMFSGAQTVIAVLLLIGARFLVGKAFPVQHRPLLTSAAVILLVLPSVMARTLPLWPEAAERNVYGFGFDMARAPAPPARNKPVVEHDPGKASPRHIVWIIDESVAYEPFGRLIGPAIKDIPHTNFGMAAALGNCSSPTHAALRSGVDARRANVRTDLRRTPSIWAYARKAGYHTRMVDGQATGAPQNMLLAPERALIDEYRQMAGDLDTDLRIADAVNADLRKPDRSFTYVVLRGVHFQYRDHYPKGMVPDSAPIAVQYDAALGWSEDQRAIGTPFVG